MLPSYVRDSNQNYFVQGKYDCNYGFALFTEDQTFPGGFGATANGKWEIVPENEVPEEIKKKLDWLFKNFKDCN